MNCNKRTPRSSFNSKAIEAAAVCATAMFMGSGLLARANMTGDSMGVGYYYGSSISPANLLSKTVVPFTAGTGEFTFYNGSALYLEINVTGTQISIADLTFFNQAVGSTASFDPVGFNGLQFTDFSQPFSGATIASVTDLSGFDSSRVSVQGNVLDLNFSGLTLTVGESEVVLDVQTGAAAVPEGSAFISDALALLLPLGARAMGGLRRRD